MVKSIFFSCTSHFWLLQIAGKMRKCTQTCKTFTQTWFAVLHVFSGLVDRGTDCSRRKRNSAHADGGPRSRVCARETLRSAPHRRERKFSGTHVCIGWPKKQQDVLCFWSRSYPGCFLSPDSNDINYFIRR
jgi:hypothetical protein